MKSFFPFCALPAGGASEDCCARATGIPSSRAAKIIRKKTRLGADTRFSFRTIRCAAPVSALCVALDSVWRSAHLITRNLLCGSSESALSRLRDDIHQGRLAALHDFNCALDRRAEVL